MNKNLSTIVSRVCSFSDPLRNIGVGYGDHLDQLTYLLFPKVADKFSKPVYDGELRILKENDWEKHTSTRGDDNEQHYSKIFYDYQSMMVFSVKCLCIYRVKLRRNGQL